MDIFLNLSKYMNFLTFQKKYSPHTIRAYMQDFEQILEWKLYGNFIQQAGTYSFIYSLRHPLNLTDNEILDYYKRRLYKLKHLKPKSKQRKLAALKSFLNWCSAEGLIDRDLAIHVHLPKIATKIPNYLSFDEILACLRYTKSDAFIKHKDHLERLLLFLLLYGGGLRLFEACNLKSTDLKLQKQVELKVLGKGGSERKLSLPKSIYPIAAAIKQLNRKYLLCGDEPLKPRKAYDWIREIGLGANLNKNLNPHALRHSYATHLMTSGCDLRILQELLGHASLSTTQKYLHLDINHLGRQMEAFNPVNELIEDD